MLGSPCGRIPQGLRKRLWPLLWRVSSSHVLSPLEYPNLPKPSGHPLCSTLRGFWHFNRTQRTCLVVHVSTKQPHLGALSNSSGCNKSRPSVSGRFHGSGLMHFIFLPPGSHTCSPDFYLHEVLLEHSHLIMGHTLYLTLWGLLGPESSYKQSWGWGEVVLSVPQGPRPRGGAIPDPSSKGGLTSSGRDRRGSSGKKWQWNKGV